jgi:hypothetical protein
MDGCSFRTFVSIRRRIKNINRYYYTFEYKNLKVDHRTSIKRSVYMKNKMFPFRNFGVLFKKFEHRNERMAPNFEFQ